MVDSSMTPAYRTSGKPVRRGMRKSTLVLTLLVFYIIGAHLRVSIYSGGSIVVPMYPMLLTGATLSLLFINQLLSSSGITFSLFSAFILLQPIITVAPESTYGDNITSIFQFTASVISALAIIYALSTVERRRIRRLLIKIWTIFIILAFLESNGLKPVFDQIRDALYTGSGRFLYMAEERDLTLYGRVRTTVFATEPSFLADSLAALILLVFFLDPKRGSLKAWARVGAMMMLSFYFSPSFKMVFYLAALMVWQFWPQSLKGMIRLLAGVGVAGLAIAIFFVPIITFFFDFTGGHLESGSFYGRIGVAHSVGLKALQNYPLFGYGIGNDTGVYPVIANEWQVSGAFYVFPWYQDLPATGLMSNGFWWQWIFLGGVGTVIFAVFLMRLLRELGVDTPLRTVVCVWIVWYAGFAFVDPHSWYMVVIFSLGAVKLRGAAARTQERVLQDAAQNSKAAPA